MTIGDYYRPTILPESKMHLVKCNRYYDNDGTRNEDTFRIAQKPIQHTAHSGDDDFIPLEDSEDENSDAMAGAEEAYLSEWTLCSVLHVLHNLVRLFKVNVT